MINTRMMYLRPGNLFKEFVVCSEVEAVNAFGRPKTSYEQTDRKFFGALADASQADQDKWKQLQHPITHTIEQPGKPIAALGEKLMMDERVFFIHAIDDCGSLGLATIYYAEERLDVK